MKYVIIDWTGNAVVPDEEFDSFEEARARIDELATIEADNNFKPDTPEWEELYEAMCEDLYAEEAKE